MTGVWRAAVLLLWASWAMRAEGTECYTSDSSFQKLPAIIRDDLKKKLDNRAHNTFQAALFESWAEECAVAAERYSEWYYNNQLWPNQQQQLLNLRAKLLWEDHWDTVQYITWLGWTGEMLYYPSVSEHALQARLTSPRFTEGKFGEWWSARAAIDSWGLRSEFYGAELHFRGDLSGHVNVHIDLHNPYRGSLWQAIQHYNEDLLWRATTHTAHRIRRALEEQGLRVPQAP